MKQVAGFSLLVSLVLACDATALEDHLFVVGADPASGNCASLELLSPWTATLNREAVGRRPVARHFAGRHYVINGSPDDDLQVIDAGTFEMIQRIAFTPGANPRDIAVLEGGVAYVSAYDSRWLYKLDLNLGAVIDSVDLGAWADPDGIPECSMLAVDGDHLFVQIQRIDRRDGFFPIPPSYLAVVDVVGDTLLDVRPGVPGVQAIELAGPVPSFKMQVEEESRRLYVSTPGSFFDGAGGIEEIDLDALESLGFIVSEKNAGLAQISGFLLVSPTKGYVLHHTDFALSSHLVAFSRVDGSHLGEKFMTFALVENLAYDPATRQLFFPDSDPNSPGIRVFDVATDSQLTGSPVATGPPPIDLVTARQGLVDAGGPGGAGGPPGFVGVMPNPAGEAVRIVWDRPGSRAIAGLDIMDARGRRVRRWVGRELSSSGSPITWDLRDDRGARVPAGVYFARLGAGSHARASRSFVVLP